MTTYAYMRVSTVEQAEGTSLDDQKRQCKGLAMTHNLTIEGFLNDPGVSGAELFFDRMARHGVKLKSGDVVIVSKLDRFSRDAADALHTIKQMSQMGVRLIINGNGDVTDETNVSGRLILEVMAVFSGHERRVIKARQKDGQAAKRAKGGHIGGSAPFGYRVEGRGHGARLVEVPSEQQAIVKAKGLRDAGLSYRAISRELAADGVKVSYEALRRVCDAAAA
jgi:DNA invertase Pin-like site-specific DNA recombinase